MTDTSTKRSDRHGLILKTLLRWIDSEAGVDQVPPGDEKKVDWLRIIPFIVLHAGCLGVVWVGWSWTAVAVAILLYIIRMFAITGFYHRYFSHKTFQTDRSWQFLFAVLGNSSVQRGPIWWAAHHRHHHRYADKTGDVHSPVIHGFLWSHMGWLTTQANFRTRTEYAGDWVRFPELRWLNRFDIVVPVLLAFALYGFGNLLAQIAPSLGTSGMQMVVWGFFISSTVLFHATNTINSLSHIFGRRRYRTPDNSRNNVFLALITLGEGWHNNHHHYSVSTRQGFFWWEIDITYYLLLLLERLKIIRNLRPVPERVKHPNPMDAMAAQ